MHSESAQIVNLESSPADAIASSREYVQLVAERLKAAAARPYQILVVDDEPVMVEMTVNLLRNPDYAFSRAGDGSEAVELVDNTSVELIICDIRMPNMLGTEFVARLRRKNIFTPVIFITGYAQYDLIAEAIRLQPFGFLEKPFEADTLRKLVRRAHQEYLHECERELQARVLSELVDEKTRELAFRTERLMAEQQLLQGIISQATFGLLAVDSSGYLHLFNEYASSRAMPSAGSGISYHGRHLRDLIQADLRSGFLTMFEQAIQSAQLQEQIFQLDNAQQTLDVIAYPITFRQEVTAVVFVIHDITKQEVMQRHLVQTAKLASIGELAAGVAHEINNPIGFVTSNVNTLSSYWSTVERFLKLTDAADGVDTIPVNQLVQARRDLDIDYIRNDIPALLQETSDGLSRVAKIVSDLKTFARADNQQPEVGDVVAIIEDSLNLCRNVIKYNLEVVRDYGATPSILCYPTQLTQVFTNLIVNAAHATVDRGRLYVSISSDASDLIVRLRDTGTGIAPEVLPRIFDPFFTTKEPGKGTGMGLSISYGIIERHGGKIFVESELGKGTEFTIKLPLKGAIGPAVAEGRSAP